MLKQCDLLLKILRVISKVVSLHDILLLSCGYSLSLIVEECVSVRINYDLGTVVKEDSCCLVREQVSQAIL